MSALQYVFGAVLIILAVFLIIVVLLQESRSAGLSGAISGGADTFFGKSKGRTMEQKLVKLTRISYTWHYDFLYVQVLIQIKQRTRQVAPAICFFYELYNV